MALSLDSLEKSAALGKPAVAAQRHAWQIGRLWAAIPGLIGQQ